MLSSIKVKLANICYVSVSFKSLYVITSDKQVLRWMLNEAQGLKEAKKDSLNELIIRGGSSQKPERVFADQLGWHCLVSFDTEDTHYFHLTSNESILVSKLHGYSITSVGWSRNTERYITKEILLGTTKGVILELTIEYDSNSETIKHSCIKLFDLSHTIFGIEYIVFTGLPCKISVTVACANNFFQFIGDPNDQGKPGFSEIFNKYKSNPAKFQKSCFEVSGSTPKSQLQIYYCEYIPHSFAWMSALGLFYGTLPSSSSEELYVEKILPLPNPKGNSQLIGIGITQHHLYFLNSSDLYIISKITQKVVHTIEFEKRQGYEINGMQFDHQSNSFFVWSFRHIYQIIIENENLNVWKYYVEMNLYQDAIQFCQKIQSPAYSRVKGMYADYLFSTGKYIEASEAYVKSEKSFEEITLKLVKNQKALQNYIESKLKSLSNDLMSQRTLLCTWLVEMYLDNINNSYMNDDEYTIRAEDKFQKFLLDYQNDLDEEATCDILQSHGRIEDWVFFADLKKKHEMVILHHINQTEFGKALNKLDQIDPVGKEALLCKYAPILMKYEPKRVIEILIEIAKYKKGQIDFSKIIPALMNADHGSREEAIKLEYFLIKELKTKDKSINNLYIFHLSETEGEKKLVEYLKYQETLREITFDPEYAMSVFKRNNKIESQIHLYSLLKMSTEAVALALENKKIDLAKQNAKKQSEYDEESSRKLWLQIAIYHIKASNVRESLIVMNESKLIKMEDLLPYFDEQDSISNFKDDICKALIEYKSKIQDLSTELTESKKSSDEVKKELRGIKERFIEIGGMQPCEICSKAVMRTTFYVYPCTHAYHRECILEFIMPELKVKDPIRYDRIHTVLNEIKAKENRLPRDKPNEDTKESIRDIYTRLNQLLAPQCYFCSPGFIETIYDDLVQDDEASLWTVEDYKIK